MATINVQFSDAVKTTVVGYAASAQDDAVWPHQGAIETTDPKWAAYYDAQDSVLIRPYLPAPSGP